MNNLENIIAGCFITLLTAMDRDVGDRALETLCTLAADRRTPEYEAKFYADLASSIAELRPHICFDEQQEVVLH